MAQIEAGHWYDADGNARHTMVAKSGMPRPTTLSDARKHGLYPSVTTILNVIDKFQLTQWRLRKAVEAAYRTSPEVRVNADGQVQVEPMERYVGRILELAHAPVDAAADEGSRIHAAVEASFQPGGVVPTMYTDHVDAVRAALSARYGALDDWQPEQRIVNRREGYAGTCDLHSITAGVVADLKCKDFTDADTKKMAYDQDRQLAAYAAALFPVDAHDDLRLVNVFVSRTQPGLVVLHEWNQQKGWTFDQPWTTFTAAAHLWRCVNLYDPRVTDAAR